MNWNINSQEGIFFIPSFLFIMEVQDMHIKVKEQEFEEGAVGYSLDVPVSYTHLVLKRWKIRVRGTVL